MVNSPRIQQQSRLLELQRLRATYNARNADKKLICYTQHTMPSYKVNWHHRVIAEKLEKWIHGVIPNLMIFTPPRNGKSELVSVRGPSFCLGVNPDHQVVIASYGSSLANKHNVAAQRVMDLKKYRELFPATRIPGEEAKSQRYKRKADLVECIKRRGYLRSVGVGGAITGEGFTRGVIDDPFKNRKEADSPVTRGAVWDWYTSTFYTRAERNAGKLLTLTRWHEDDLAGRLLKQMKHGGKFAEQWEVLSLPAIKIGEPSEFDPRQEGEPLWPWKYPLNTLYGMRETMGGEQGRDWQALMQQRPRTEGGQIIQRRWWKFYQIKPATFDEVVMSIDCNFKDKSKQKSGSYVVIQVWGRIGADKYLLDQWREKCGFVDTVNAIKRMKSKWPSAYRIYIEDKANGPAVIDTLKGDISGIIPVEPDGSKEARLYAVSAQIQSGNVYLPEDAPWVHDYIEEHSAFPNGTNDDQVDATSQALRKLDSSGVSQLERLLTM